MTPIEITLFVLFAVLFVLIGLSHWRNHHTLADLTWDREVDKMEYRSTVSRRDAQCAGLMTRMERLERASGVVAFGSYQTDLQRARAAAMSSAAQTSGQMLSQVAQGLTQQARAYHHSDPARRLEQVTSLGADQPSFSFQWPTERGQ